ncbi:insulinase family protein [Alcaligenaceae bacterium CGII-47]|nr:insulinase family protein [Alcaligenaceae bacterium CGII-47]
MTPLSLHIAAPVHPLRASKKWSNSAFIVLFSWFIFLIPSAWAFELPAGIQAGPSVQGVSQYQMDNGLRIVLAPDASRPQTTVNMTYLVGSRMEGAGETGMAHLLEHLMFRGTDTLPDAMAEFSRRGLASNGSTTVDRTNYYATFSAEPETLRWYLGWQADAMTHSRISRQDLDAEMTVVRNEMERGENSPFGVLIQQVSAAAYVWHPYGRSTIGARSDVENVDIAQLRAFYHQYYQPDNAVLIVTGQFDPAQTLQWIQESFARIPRPTRALLPGYTVEPVQQGARAVTLRRPGGSPIIAAQYHIPAGNSADYAALDLAANMLTDTPSGLLTRKLVDTGLVSSAFGFAAALAQPGYALFGAQLEPGADPDKALTTLEAELENLPPDALDSAGLERARTAWLTNWKQVYTHSSALASALSSAAALGDWRLFFLQRDQVEQMTLERIRTEAQTWFVSTNRTSGRYLPTEQPHYAPEPQAADLATLLSTLQENTPRPEVAAFDTSPAAIDAATQRSELELPNGTIALALLPKPTGGNQVQAILQLNFGSAEQLRGVGSAPSLTAAMLAHGAQGLTRQQIEDRLTQLEAQVDFDGEDNTVRISMTTIHQNLPAVLDLVLQLLRTPTFPSDELEKIQRQIASSIENAMSSPSALALRTLQRYDQPWAGDDIRYKPTFAQSLQRIKALTRQDLQNFYDRFYGAGDIALAVVGDFDPQVLQDHLRSGLAGWKRAPAYTRLPDPWYATPPKTFEISTPGKANASYLASVPLKLQDTDPQYPALLLANYMLGGSEDSRLWQRIRVQDGLSYDVGSMLQASSFEPSGSWTFYASMAPQNAQALTRAIKEALLTVRREGFTADEVRSAIRSILEYQKLARSNDRYLVSNWISKLRTGRDFAWTQKMLDTIAGLDADQVNAALRATLDPDQLVIAVAAAQP